MFGRRKRRREAAEQETKEFSSWLREVSDGIDDRSPDAAAGALPQESPRPKP